MSCDRLRQKVVNQCESCVGVRKKAPLHAGSLVQSLKSGQINHKSTRTFLLSVDSEHGHAKDDLLRIPLSLSVRLSSCRSVCRYELSRADPELDLAVKSTAGGCARWRLRKAANLSSRRAWCVDGALVRNMKWHLEGRDSEIASSCVLSKPSYTSSWRRSPPKAEASPRGRASSSRRRARTVSTPSIDWPPSFHRPPPYPLTHPHPRVSASPCAHIHTRSFHPRSPSHQAPRQVLRTLPHETERRDLRKGITPPPIYPLPPPFTRQVIPNSI